MLLRSSYDLYSSSCDRTFLADYALHAVEGFSVKKWHWQTGMGKHVFLSFFTVFVFCSQTYRRRVDVHVHRVYIENMYVSVLLLLHYNSTYHEQ